MIDQCCPACLSVVTWDARRFAKTGWRVVRLHTDGMGRYCTLSGKPFLIVERAAVSA